VEDKTDPKSLPQYWLVLDSGGQALYIRRAETPMIADASKPQSVVHCAFDYTPAKEKTIVAPPRAR